MFQKLRNAELTFKKPDVFFLYLRLLFTHLFLVQILSLKKTQENIFGNTIHFFHYASFLSMFEEIFIHEEYKFTSDNKNPLIIDCGTNIGLELIYYKRLYPKSTITCFEPDKKTYTILKKNVEVNNLEKVDVFNIAIGSRKAKINFYIDTKDPGSLIMSTHKKRGLKYKTVVQMDKLSSFVKSPVDFLKLDIEGNEDEVIEDLHRRKKLKQIKQMVIEYHHHIERNKDKLSDLLSILEKNKFGYQMTTLMRTPFEEKKFQDILIYFYRK